MRLPIRLARSNDAAACAAIVNGWIDETQWLPRVHSREAIADMIAAGIPIREFWVAGDPVVGYLSFNIENSQVMGLYASQRGNGAGKALMDRVKEGRRWIQLWTHMANDRAHSFYQREGFRDTGERRDGADGISEMRMVWGQAQ